MTALDIGAAGILIFAGIGKLVAPAALSRAVGDLLVLKDTVSSAWIRFLAAVEITVAIVFLASPAKQIGDVGYALLALVGLTFVTFGALGRARGSVLPCGCFGSQEGKPFGLGNIAIGVGFLIVAALSFLSVGTSGSTTTNFENSLLGTTVFLLTVSLLTNRGVIATLIRSNGGGT
jgi:hypothetical protein